MGVLRRDLASYGVAVVLVSQLTAVFGGAVPGGPQTGLANGLLDRDAVVARRFGALEVGQSASTNVKTIEVEPAVMTLSDGSTETIYTLPDREVITTVTPPPGFNPLEASDAQLAELGFPLRPSDASGLQAWTTVMAAFRSDFQPTGALVVATDGASASPSYSTLYANWAGYVAGTLYTHSHTYVAVKSVFTVPSNSGTCAPSNDVAFWIGLGGTTGNNDLVQQGIACGNSALGGSAAYRPWTEFPPVDPIYFCGYNTWTLPAGDTIYQNMSFQASSNTAYFYLEDEKTGVAHSCHHTPPSGWSWDLNTAEWIAEANNGVSVNFHSVRFSDAETELDSNSSWVTLGSQPVTTVVEGSSSSYYCIKPGGIGSDHASFTDTWYQTYCW